MSLSVVAGNKVVFVLFNPFWKIFSKLKKET